MLLVEDSELNQEIALALLRMVGIEADLAQNGQVAVDRVRDGRYEAVLMDMQMPEMDGIAATRIIRTLPGCAALPIIAMTANALPEDREASFAAGMDDYLAKPIRQDALAEALRRIRPVDRDVAPPAEVANGRLDGAAIESLRQLGGDDFLAEVIDTFVADVGTLLATLRCALDKGDAAEVRRMAHTLKSEGATLGASEFAELCGALERQAKDGRLEEAPGLVVRIEEERRSLDHALGTLLPKART